MHPSRLSPVIAIDLLRFACAMLVVAYHFDVAFWKVPTWRSAIMLAPAGAGFAGNEVTRIGWIGVELFFVISGLVIARSATGQTAALFLRRRALRLVPGAWACAGLTAAAMILSGLGDTVAVPLLRSLTFWPVGEQIDGSYWSLGIECSFYLVMAAAIGVGTKANTVERTAVAIGLLSTAFWATWLLVGRSIAPSPLDRYVMLALLPHGCFFAIGVLIAACKNARSPGRVALLGLFMLTATVEIGFHALERAQAGVIASPVLALVAFLMGLALLLSADRLQPWLSRLIDPATARTIGLLTYPLYLLHQDAGAAMLGALVAAGLSLRLAAGTTVAMMIVLAWLIATQFEPRLRHALTTALQSGLMSDTSSKFSQMWRSRNSRTPSAPMSQRLGPESSQPVYHHHGR